MGNPAMELQALSAAYEALKDLDADQRTRAINWLASALSVSVPAEGASTNTPSTLQDSDQTIHQGDKVPTPKNFVTGKKPQGSAERIACLAYYLTNYRDQPAFKTPDITAINTEAAQQKLGNPGRDVDNADRASGYLVSAGGGQKQLSARGEAVVNALPSREAVAQAQQEHPITRRTRRTAAKKPAPKKASTTKKAAAKTGLRRP